MPFLSHTSRLRITNILALLLVLVILGSCGKYLRKEEERKVLARVGENILYEDQVTPLLNEGISKSDSAIFVTNYINNWAVNHLLMSKARINLTEDKMAEFERLVTNYRNDLYTQAYKDAYVQQLGDTLISEAELARFYERESENFKLREKLVRLRFVELPSQFIDQENVAEKFKRFNEEDKQYLDSISLQFKKIHFNDSIWVSASQVVSEIRPLTLENENEHLKKSQFFELTDSLGVYLGKVTDVLQVNEIAPLEHIGQDIKQVLLNRRKQEFLRKLETEIIDEAVKDNEFEIYEKE